MATAPTSDPLRDEDEVSRAKPPFLRRFLVRRRVEPRTPPPTVSVADAERDRVGGWGLGVGGRRTAAGRRSLHRPLAVGKPLPTMPLPLTVHLGMPVDLEATYSRAADDAYLS
jgi:hypothetical protein